MIAVSSVYIVNFGLRSWSQFVTVFNLIECITIKMFLLVLRPWSQFHVSI